MINFLDRIKQMFAPESDDDVTNKKYVDDKVAAAASASRKILTTGPLTGGGSLTGDLTIGINPATAATATAPGAAGSMACAADNDTTSRDKAVSPAGLAAALNTKNDETLQPLVITSSGSYTFTTKGGTATFAVIGGGGGGGAGIAYTAGCFAGGGGGGSGGLNVVTLHNIEPGTYSIKVTIGGSGAAGDTTLTAQGNDKSASKGSNGGATTAICGVLGLNIAGGGGTGGGGAAFHASTYYQPNFSSPGTSGGSGGIASEAAMLDDSIQSIDTAYKFSGIIGARGYGAANEEQYSIRTISMTGCSGCAGEGWHRDNITNGTLGSAPAKPSHGSGLGGVLPPPFSTYGCGGNGGIGSLGTTILGISGTAGSPGAVLVFYK